MYVFVVDIDGTVADTQPRIDAVSQKYNVPESHWQLEQVEEFTKTEYIKQDKVIPGAEVLPALARRCGAKIVFLTGRSEQARRATRIWLQNHLNIFDSVPLVMRAKGDYSPTPECKERIFLDAVFRVYKGANFVFFDDDLELLPIYSKYGLALRAPDCWKLIHFKEDEEKEEGKEEKDDG